MTPPELCVDLSVAGLRGRSHDGVKHMTNHDDAKPLMVSVATGRAMLGIGHTKMFELLRNNDDLESILIGRKRLVLLSSIYAFVERQRAAQAARTGE